MASLLRFSRAYFSPHLCARMQWAGIKAIFTTKWVTILQSRELGPSSPLSCLFRWSGACLVYSPAPQLLMWPHPPLPPAKSQGFTRANIYSLLTVREGCWSAPAKLGSSGLCWAWLSATGLLLPWEPGRKGQLPSATAVLTAEDGSSGEKEVNQQAH